VTLGTQSGQANLSQMLSNPLTCPAIAMECVQSCGGRTYWRDRVSRIYSRFQTTDGDGPSKQPGFDFVCLWRVFRWERSCAAIPDAVEGKLRTRRQAVSYLVGFLVCASSSRSVYRRQRRSSHGDAVGVNASHHLPSSPRTRFRSVEPETMMGSSVGENRTSFTVPL